MKLSETRPFLSLRLSLQGFYQGAAPLLAAIVIACTTSNLVWPHLKSEQLYRDVVVGPSTWKALDKDRDFRTFFLTLALTAVTSLTITAVFAGLSRGDRTESIRRALNGLMLLTLLPAAWRLGHAIVTPKCDFWAPDACALSALLVATALGLYRYRLFLTGALVEEIGSATLFGAAMGFMAGFGVAVFLGRLWPGICATLGSSAGSFATHGAVAAIAITVAIFACTKDVTRLRVRLFRLLFLLQVPLALLFFVVVPPTLQDKGIVLGGQRFSALKITVGLVVLAAFISLGRQFRRWSSDPERDTLGITAVLSPLCLSAVAVFMVLPTLDIPVLSGDLFHSAEQYLPWQQLVAFHKVPYVDFIPMQGLRPFLEGALNQAFFRGTTDGFPAAVSLLVAIWAAVTFLSGCAVAGPFVALFVSFLFVLCPFVIFLDRLFFLAPALFLLSSGRLLSRPVGWLSTWGALCLFEVLYNPTLGPAIVLGSLPIAGWMTWRAVREQGRALAWLLTGVGACALLVLSVRFTRGIAFGFMRYLLENVECNTVAYGIPFEEGFGEKHPFPLALTDVSWELFRLSWLVVVGAAALSMWREWSRPRDERRGDVLCLGLLICLVLPLDYGYLLGRIDTTHFSRTGLMAIVALTNILPVVLLLGRSLLQAAPIALALGLGAGMIDLWASESSYYERWKSKPFAVRSIPPWVTLTNGKDVGMPRLGRLACEPTLLGSIRQLKDIMGEFLQPGETFLDFTNCSAYYYYLNLPVPVLYASSYTAPTGHMQDRMLHQLQAAPPPLVLIAPAINHDSGPASLRSYRLYREYIRQYVPVQRGPFTFLVDPSRVPEDAPTRNPTKACEVLDPLFTTPLRNIPVAWGKSWGPLAGRFQEVARLDARRGPAAAAAAPGSPARIVFDLKDLSLTGADADFLRVDFICDTNEGGPEPAFAVRWRAAPEGGPGVSFSAKESTPLLIPLGSNPRWARSLRIEELEIVLDNPAACKRFDVANVQLLRLTK